MLWRTGLVASLTLLAVAIFSTPAAAEEVAVFDPDTGRWHLRWEDGRVTSFFYGIPGDVPIMGDWDCDGEDTVAMFRQATGFAYIRNSNDLGVADLEFFYGQRGDKPVAGDWDGDGCDTLGILRGGRFFLTNQLATVPAEIEFFFGVPGDQPFAGDFNGDGRDSVGLYRQSNGFVYFADEIPAGDIAPTDNSFFYGMAGDKVIAGDWDGDGDDTVGIFRPSQRRFFLSNVNAQVPGQIEFDLGASHMIPAAGALGPPRGIPGVSVETAASGFSSPLFLTAPAGDERLFVVEKAGRVWTLTKGVKSSSPFLDVRSLTSDGSEQGLLGFAFHPQYGPSQPRFYIHYTNNAGDTVVAEYHRPSDFGLAGPTVVTTLLTQTQPFTNHNGGMIQFGPDGRLYVGLGDGGSGGDPLGHGQNANTRLGAIVAINVDTGADQIWAIGLRNPWRFDFDGGEIYIGDVGQNAWEEVSVGSATEAGQNFGWATQEGFACYPPGTFCIKGGLIQPAVAYKNPSEGCSVTGGFVYRGSAIPHLAGTYLYSDFCSGFLRGFRYGDGRVLDTRDWTLDVGSLGRVLSFGEDSAGELYVLTSAGDVLKVVAG